MTRFDRQLLAAALALGLTVGTAQAAVIGKPKSQGIAPGAVLGVYVTDIDPQQLLQTRRLPSAIGTGPFDGPATTQLYVIAIYDASLLGVEGFDQSATFTLPDGNVYEFRLDPVEARGHGGLVQRAELGPDPVPVLPLWRAKRVARLLAGNTLTERQLRNAVFAAIPLPVSGTWVTGHGLYGEWTVRIAAQTGGIDHSVQATSFRIAAGR